MWMSFAGACSVDCVLDVSRCVVIWHSEHVGSIDAAVTTILSLLPRLDSFDCIRITLRVDLKMLIFQRPWTQTIYVLSGNVTPLQVAALRDVERDLATKQFGSTSSWGGIEGLSFVSASQALSDVSRISKFFLEVLSRETKRFTIEGLKSHTTFQAYRTTENKGE